MTGASATPALARAHTWYLRAGAGDGGQGTRQAPFGRPAQVELASRPGDRIVVLPAAPAAGPLDGGLQLKARQVLAGAGAPVLGAPATAAVPGLTNTTARLDGDAVRLADGTTVRNLRITGPRRGGIYGLDVTRATVTGNDVSGHNVSCTPGFHIPRFAVPTTLPGVGVPIPDGLHNGWAGIMVDTDRGATRVGIRGNHVHDADCGDGIDIRVSGTASVRAVVAGNDVRELRQGQNLSSILAIGLQSRDHARLVARVSDNREAGLGNDEDAGVGPSGADSEGVFVNPVGPSSLRAVVTGNHYTHTPGRSGFSANGLEYVAMGDGSRGLLEVRDSTFSGTPGDVIEQLALGTNARLRMRLHRVVATGSTGFGGSGIGDTVVIPGNDADCVIGASGGAGNTVDLVVRDSTLTDCANNGLTFGSAVANGSGATALLKLDVTGSTITGNHGANLRVGNVAALDALSVRVQGTDLSGSRGVGSSPANLTVEDLGTTGHATIDLGGGALGSAGGNCLAGGTLTALLVRYAVIARGNWWGRPQGPDPVRAPVVGGTLDAGGPLATVPPGC